MNTVRESKMKCDAFWGLDEHSHKYMVEFRVEFSKKEVEELLPMPSSKGFEYFGQAVWASLVAQYEKHNKD